MEPKPPPAELTWRPDRLAGSGNWNDCRCELRAVEICLPALLNNFRLDLSLAVIGRVHRKTEEGRKQKLIRQANPLPQ